MSTSVRVSSVLIEVKSLNKFLGPKQSRQHILKDISFSIEQGEYISIIGQSGSGKSTLMNLLGCLDSASSGELSFRGNRIDLLSSDDLAGLRLKSFGFVFQRYNLLNSLSALENVALPAIYSSLNVGARHTRAMKLLKDLGLEDKYDSKPNELSGGQQQRVSIARALMNGGEVILADEPTGALDSKSGEIVLKILEELHQQGHTIILVTHDSNIAKRANRIIEIKDGEILSDRMNKDPVQLLSGKKFTVETKFSLASQIYEASKMSIHSIWSNRLRSFLTMLGIIIGICSVTIIIAIGNGANQKFISDWKGNSRKLL
ncbi:ATP-binding cassette domain-containing protein [Acinetobacter seifertii]|nr:ATP-binding cassette domain-containing protein [Acinetobacter seifertii]